MPISLPTTPGPRKVRLRPARAAAFVASPYSFAGQAQVHPGARWLVELELPLMDRASAEPWIAALLQLDGPAGTFLLGDPLGTSPRGSAAGTPRVAGGGQTGRTLSTDGWTPDAAGVLLAGDWIQLGSGEQQRIYKVQGDVDADAAGAASVSIWPDLRESPADAEALVLTAPQGVFRLAGGELPYEEVPPDLYDIAFAAVEAL